MSNNQNKIQYKILLIGNTNVGKTSVLKKMITGDFSDKNISTIGMDQKTIYTELELEKNEDKKQKEKYSFEVTILDTAGQEKFRAITNSFFKGADGILILYDVTNRQSFEQVKLWIESLEEALGNHKNGKYLIILIGNKIDLVENRKVSEEEAKKFKSDFMLNLYMETSAKTGFNAREIFVEAARVLYKEYNQYKKVDEEKKIKLPKLSEQDPNDVLEKKKCSC